MTNLERPGRLGAPDRQHHGTEKPVTIRPFEPADAPRVTELVHRAYAELGDRGLNFTAVDQDVATTLRRASAEASRGALREEGVVATMTLSLPRRKLSSDSLRKPDCRDACG
ncbi:hypothetical protein [Streptomyces sp. NBRC 109706]|uniref:hypothetical protein n=1 Tax=Streptomyces sp. NBRC 109706 TaxID=1550035 RepID=UPI0007823962|nr:hypothetical protein [Streptomyces sp. NBRC 109706]